MSRADLEAAAAEKYPLWTWHDDAQRYRQEGYIQGRLDQAEADAQIAETSARGYDVSDWDDVDEAACNRIAAEIRKGRVMDDATPHRCPGCGRFTSGHAGLSEGSAETWYWSCACGRRGEEGF